MATGFDESDEVFDPDSSSPAYDARPPRRSPKWSSRLSMAD
jgi:hypothetical protein